MVCPRAQVEGFEYALFRAMLAQHRETLAAISLLAIDWHGLRSGTRTLVARLALRATEVLVLAGKGKKLTPPVDEAETSALEASLRATGPTVLPQCCDGDWRLWAPFLKNHGMGRASFLDWTRTKRRR